jgi:hypothetical protein
LQFNGQQGDFGPLWHNCKIIDHLFRISMYKKDCKEKSAGFSSALSRRSLFSFMPIILLMPQETILLSDGRNTFLPKLPVVHNIINHTTADE